MRYFRVVLGVPRGQFASLSEGLERKADIVVVQRAIEKFRHHPLTGATASDNLVGQIVAGALAGSVRKFARTSRIGQHLPHDERCGGIVQRGAVHGPTRTACSASQSRISA